MKIFQKLAFMIWASRRAVFYRDLADAFVRKVNVRDQLEREASNCRLLKDDIGLTVMRALLERHDSGDGSTLRDMMAGVVPRGDLMLLAAVDGAGKDKSDALLRTADAVDFQLQSLRTLGIQLVVPLLAVPMVGAICYITAEIIVSIAESVPASVWVGYNAFVRTLSEFITHHWQAITAGLVGVVGTVAYSLPRWVGGLRLKLDRAPGYALYRDYNAATVLSALAMLLSSGKTLMEALQGLQTNASPWLRWHLRRITNSLEDNPTDYQAAFASGLMPLSVRARLASLMDSSQGFDAALVTLGSSEVKRLETTVRLSAQAINWTLTGLLVSLAVVLSVGQMTIASAVSKEADPSRMVQQRR